MSTPIFNRVVLKDGVSFANWRGDLRAELSRADVLGYVFHDIKGIDSETEPTEPKFSKSESVESLEKAKQEYKVRRRAWVRGEIEAQNIIIQRLDDSKKPHDYHRYTAKQLYEMIARSNEVTNLLPHSEAFDAFISTRFTTTAEEYCTTFLQTLQNVNNASESLSPSNSISANFRISDELASVFFVKGTRHVKWLDIWRETKAVNMFQYAPLQHMISSLRATAGTRDLTTETHSGSKTDDTSNLNPMSAVARSPSNDPNSRCKRCRHNHKNKDCFKQHPERAPKDWVTIESDEENEDEKQVPIRKGKGKVSFIRPTTDSPFNSDNDGHVIIC